MAIRTPDFDSWRRIPLRLDQTFSYLRQGFLWRTLSRLLAGLALLILWPVHHIWFGMHFNGRENLRAAGKGGAVVICNHVHWLDCTAVARMIYPHRAYYVTLQSNLELPVIRRLVRLFGGIPIPRQPRLLPGFKESIHKALRNGDYIVIYPEGELNPYCQKLRPFQNSAFSFAADTAVPILPLCITYRAPKGLFRIKKRPCMDIQALEPIWPDANLPRRERISRMKETALREMEAAASVPVSALSEEELA
ncbi:MAG: lysophospholipid acyltransferase family protein [Oscillospiraceae bacterium]